jgi:Gram-negative porin
MGNRTWIGIVAGIASLGIAAARADDATPSFSLSGFGTLGMVHSDNDHADYLVDAFHPNGPGFTRSWSADPDSRVGAQLTGNITLKLSVVLQVVSQQRYDNSYRPGVEWANVKFQASPDFSIRAGRIVLPVFMATDSRHVGYANPWVRPPVEVYSLVPVTSSDGVDASYRLRLGGETNNTFQATFGSSETKFPGGAGLGTGTAKVRRIVALVDTVESGFASARIIYGQASLTVPEYAQLFDAFRQFGPQGDAIASRYEVQDRLVKFVGVGATYDPGTWFASGEWAKFDTHSALGAKSAWYVSGGPRLGKFTPYATYARIKADGNTSDPGLDLAGLPPQAVPLAAFLNATLNSQLDAIPRQSTLSVGVRWDFWRNAALKVQYDRVGLAAGPHGTFGNVQPGFETGGKVQLFSAAVDFLF